MEDYKKKYEEALNRAKVINPGTTDYNIVTEIFPELKKSDDEKIRKELTDFLDDILHLGKDANFDKYGKADCADWIAWLEKQGTPAKLSEEEQNRFAKGVLTSCALSFINYLDAHAYEGKMCVSNGECKDIENAFHNAMWDRLHRYYCKYIEKQGEQKVVKFMTKSYITPNPEFFQWIYNRLVYQHHENPNMDYMRSLKERIEDMQEIVNVKTGDGLVKQKPAWSEEDEEAFHCLEYTVKRYYDDKDTINKYCSWLKSLKERMKGE